jgi:hypothetical protein
MRTRLWLGPVAVIAALFGSLGWYGAQQLEEPCAAADRLNTAGQVDEARKAYVVILKTGAVSDYAAFCAAQGMSQLPPKPKSEDRAAPVVTSTQPEKERAASSWAAAVSEGFDRVGKNLTNRAINRPVGPGEVGWVALLAFLVIGVRGWARYVDKGRLPTISVSTFINGAADEKAVNEKAVEARFREVLAMTDLRPDAGIAGGALDAVTTVVKDSPVPQAKWIAVVVSLMRTILAPKGLVASATVIGPDDLTVTLSWREGGPVLRTEAFSSDAVGAIRHDAAAKAAYATWILASELASDRVIPQWRRWTSRDGFAAYQVATQLPHDKAGPLLQRAVEKDPSNADALLAYAEWLEEATSPNRLGDAIEIYEELRALWPHLLEPQYRLSAALAVAAS